MTVRQFMFAYAALAACFAGAARADEIRILSAGAVKSPVSELIARFERETGHKVSAEFATAGELAKKLAANERADILIMPAENLDGVERDGRIVAGTRAPLGLVGIGVAVRDSAPSPDISTTEAFKRTLLAAKSIVYVDPKNGTSGRHFAQVLERLGIAAEMKPKTTLGPGGYVVAPVGRGEIELGVHQISEILPVPGVKLVGPLPPEIQKWTTYTAALMTGAAAPDAARTLMRYLVAASSRTAFTSRGFSAPE
jgi:molybdate transport system substrate-binding protein